MKTIPMGILCGVTAVLAANTAAQSPLDNVAPDTRVRAATQEPIDGQQRFGAALDLGDLLVPIHTAAPDEGLEYGVWAAADSYKVGFHADMTFVPYLGSDYPQDQPMSWRTESVRAGGQELLQVGESPRRWHNDYRYEYRYEAVTEAYDIRVEGLEQTFVIHARPATAGDLVVSGRITTALRGPAFASQRRAIPLFDAAGTQILGYGVATAIDATGRRGDVLTSHENGRIVLTVPDAWLRDAVYPVTIDPLLTRTTVTGGFPHYTTDIIRDDTGNQFMVVHTRGSSAGNQDAYGYIMNDNYSNRAVVYSDVTTSWSTDHIRCAVAGSPQKYCVVFERHFSASGYRVRYHMHNSGDLTLRTSFSSISPPGGQHNWRPDVGGHVLPSGVITPPAGTDFAVVYQTEVTGNSTFSNTSRSTIRARLIASNGTLGSEWIVQGQPLFGSSDYERPSINQQALRPAGSPGTTSWLVAFQGYNNNIASDDWDVSVRMIKNNGTTSSTSWGVPSNSNNKHSLGPQIAGQSGRYLVAFTQRPVALIGSKTSSIDGDSLILDRLDWPRSGTASNRPEKVLYGPFTGNRMRLGSVGFDYDTDSHWVVQSASLRANGGTGRTIVDRVGFNGAATESLTLDWAASGEQGVPGGVCYDDDNDLFLVSWLMNGTTGNGFANRFDYVSPGAVVRQGTSCSSSTIGWSGSQQIGSEFTSVRISGAPGNALAFLVVALSTRNQDLTSLGMNGCFLLVQNTGPNYLGMVTRVLNASGSGFVPMPLPEFVGSDLIYFQWFHTEAGANALGFTSTDRLRVPVVK